MIARVMLNIRAWRAAPRAHPHETPDGGREEERGRIKEEEVEAKVIYLEQSHEQGF